ncbi:hypothetical protein D3C78_767660 [compost metagenome]
MLVEVEPAVRAARASGGADDQTQHAVAPAADPVLVGFGQQVVHGVHALRVDFAQWCLGKIITGVEKRQRLRAGRMFRRPIEVLFQIALQCWPPAGEARVKEEILHVDRDELLRAAQLITVGAASYLTVMLFALPSPADILRPAGQVEQARIIAEGEAPFGLPAALFRQANLALTAQMPGALVDQAPFAALPEAGAIVDMRQLVQHGGQQLLAHCAVGATGFFAGCAAIGEAGQQPAIEFKR